MKILRRYFPLIIVAAAFLWASITIALRRHEVAPPGAIVIRIGHFQLESGVRDAFDKLGKDFANLPEIKKLGDVRIVQEAIPEGLYGQWLTSQMMAEQPPDLVEYGMLPQHTLIAYQNRYFIPLNTMAGQPNPFNVGTELEGVPLKETFTEGMRTGYQEEMQAYTRVPLSRFAQRVFYNRTLLRKLTGLEKPPTELRAFLKLCDEIRSKKLPNGQPYTPITSSSYHASKWFNNMADPLSYANLFVADFTRDGTVGTDENYAAFASKRMSLESPTWQARLEVTKDLARTFQPGFVGVTRDEALFLFAQQKGVFISTGTWDVNSLIEQAHGKFEVGIADFPFPAKDDPEYGKLVFGPVYDPAGVGFPFGVTRFSRHPEMAQKFLLFLASKKGNAELNRIIGWIPNVVDVPPPPALAGFKSIETGMYMCGDFTLGGKSLVRWTEVFSKFQSDPKYTREELAKDFEADYRSMGKADWEEQQRDWRRGLQVTEQALASLRGEALLTDAARPAASKWVRYRSATTGRQVSPEISFKRMQRIVTVGPDRPVAPYDYLPEALERAKKNIAGAGK